MQLTSTMTAGVPLSIALFTVFKVPGPPSSTTQTDGMMVSKKDEDTSKEDKRLIKGTRKRTDRPV